MTHAEFKEMLASLAEGGSKRKYEEVAAHFAENVFYSDPLNYTFTSKTSLWRFFCDDDDHEQYCKFHDLIFDEDRQFGAAEYTYEGTYRYHGTVWINVDGNKIVSWREYQHQSTKTWGEFWKIKCPR
ncbi:hypothetical protein BH20ACI2_BH20ACI2_29050 [soil metagenome]